jgi:CDP-diacylglycerol---serine O-phosphatidyltransferase
VSSFSNEDGAKAQADPSPSLHPHASTPTQTPTPAHQPQAKRLPGGIPIRALIPNVITVLAMCAGLTALRFALAGKWEQAVIAILIAGALDGIDGRIARLLRGTSRFGAELDSLSDVIAFGVVPAVMIYQWALNDIRFGWAIALAYAVCCALRLARFNANLDVDDQPHKKHGFNVGVPSPAGAGLVLSPIFASLWLADPAFSGGTASALTGDNLAGVLISQSLFQSAWLVVPVVIGTALLMVSNLPTFSWLTFRISREWRIPLILLLVLLGVLIFDPDSRWIALTLIAITYAISIGFSVSLFAKRRANSLSADSAAKAEPPVLK